MASWSGIPELREYYRTLGPLRFWAIMGLLFGWIGVGVWLQQAVNWPEAYGFHCRGKGCLFVSVWHSPALVEHGGLLQWMLFIHLWTIPAVLVACLIIALRRKLKQRRPRIVNGLLSSKATNP